MSTQTSSSTHPTNIAITYKLVQRRNNTIYYSQVTIAIQLYPEVALRCSTFSTPFER